MEKVQLNFPPTIAKRYIAEWVKQSVNDQKADDNTRKILQDIKTLADIGFSHLAQPTKAN